MTLRPRLLHVANGDVLATHLAGVGLDGEIAVWADALHEGPVPRSLATADWIEPRARALSSLGYLAYDKARATLSGWQRPLDEARPGDELVFWVETDLFDQLLLVRHLAWLSIERPSQPASLVYAPDFPESESPRPSPFASADLAALAAGRVPVSTGALARGLETWQAFTAGTPRDLAARAALPATDLPWLRAALDRWFDEFPAADDGLSLTERTALEFLVKEGEMSGRDLFGAVSARERRPFMGDLCFFERLRSLAAGDRPLVDPAFTRLRDAAGCDFRATALGREVFEGTAHRVRTQGIDRWFGGVHVAGHAPAFLWDRVARRFAVPPTTH